MLSDNVGRINMNACNLPLLFFVFLYLQLFVLASELFPFETEASFPKFVNRRVSL